jgi:hypothetical protein
MARLCGQCMTCHPLGAKCAKKKTLKQLAKESRKDTVKFLKDLKAAQKATRDNPSPHIYGAVAV